MYTNKIIEIRSSQVVVAGALNPSTQQADLCEFKSTLFYRVSSRAAKAMKRDLVSNKTPTINLWPPHVCTGTYVCTMNT